MSNQAVEETAKRKVEWPLVGKLFRGRKRYFLVAFLCMVISISASYISPLVIRAAIDSVIGNEVLDAPEFVLKAIESFGGMSVLSKNIWICSIVIVIMAIINSTFVYFRGVLTAKAAEGIALELRDRMYEHISHLSYEYHVKAETGDLLQRCSSDVETVRRFLGMQLSEIIRCLVLLVIGLTIMSGIDPLLTLISLCMVPVLFFVSYFYFKSVRHSFAEADMAEGILSNVLQESMTGIRVVRACGQQQQEMAKFNDKNGNFRDLIMKVNNLMGNYWGFTDILSFIQHAALIVASVLFVVNGRITVGTMIAFNSMVGMLLWPVRQMGRILADLGKATVSLGRISDVLEIEREDFSGVEPPIDGDIVFKNVTFGYDPAKPVLKNVSFTVKKGQTIAVLGATGSGKSTLVHLLQRLYDYDQGSITIGGVELKKIARKHLRRNVGIVLQEPFLYSRSIKDNIRITRTNAEDDELESVSRIAALHGVISDFDKGYDTEIGERGVTLSGGQKQRVAIARMLMQKSPIIIFDDSLSAVDTQTDAQIREALSENRTGATTFIISHRITTLSECDFIIVLENGEVSEQGTHEELSAMPGLYKRVWEMQSELGDELENEAEEGDNNVKLS